MTAIPLWADKLYNKPLALDLFTNETFCEFANLRLTGTIPEKITAATLAAPPMRAMADEASAYSEGVRKPFRSKDGLAVVPVRGTLVQRGGWLDAECGLVGYNTIMQQVRAAQNDPEIIGVFMPYDSGGGQVAGLFAAAEELASMAKAEGGKPIYAWLDERACSAAYVLASACDRIYGRREAVGASISAIINVLDTSKAFDKAGLEPVVIRPEWADMKALGQRGEKIDAKTVNRLRKHVDEASDQVVEFVSAMRGISAESIRALRGDFLTGPDLFAKGLMDDIISEREAWDALLEEARS